MDHHVAKLLQQQKPTKETARSETAPRLTIQRLLVEHRTTTTNHKIHLIKQRIGPQQQNQKPRPGIPVILLALLAHLANESTKLRLKECPGTGFWLRRNTKTTIQLPRHVLLPLLPPLRLLLPVLLLSTQLHLPTPSALSRQQSFPFFSPSNI